MATVRSLACIPFRPEAIHGLSCYRIGNKVSILSGPSPKQNRKFINFKNYIFPRRSFGQSLEKKLVTGSGVQRA